MTNDNDIFTTITVGVGGGFNLSAVLVERSEGLVHRYTLTGPDGETIGERHNSESGSVVLLVETFGITWVCAETIVRHAAGITTSIASVTR